MFGRYSRAVVLLIALLGCRSTRISHPFAEKYDSSESSFEGVETELRKPTSVAMPPVFMEGAKDENGGGGIAQVRFVETQEANSSVAEIAAPMHFASTQNSNEPGISLDELTQLALANNPVIRQAEAATRKVAGYRTQVGLYANPAVGYNASQLADRSTDQHTAFVTQDIVTGQKLERSVNVLEHEVRAMTWDAETQRHTVLSDVKQLYYQYLGAQLQASLAKDFVVLGQQGVEITGKRKIAGEASQLDVLQTEIQLQQLKVAERQANIAVKESWKQLSATVGIPSLEARNARGEFPEVPSLVNWEEEYAKLLESSPEIKACLARICRARANLDRQQSQLKPNLSLMAAAGYDRGTDSQIVNTQVSVPWMLHNRNQGNVSAAYSEYARATQDLQRVQLSLKSRLAETAQNYESAAASVNSHRSEIVPKAVQSLELAQKVYQAGEMDFLQVLVIRNTYFQAKLAYLSAQIDLAKSQSLLEEYLLSGSLDNVPDSSMDDGLRGQTLSGQ